MILGVHLFNLSIIVTLIAFGFGIYRLSIAVKEKGKGKKNFILTFIPFLIVLIGVWFCYNLAISIAY